VRIGALMGHLLLQQNESRFAFFVWIRPLNGRME
jgi:hypothetical protein